MAEKKQSINKIRPYADRLVIEALNEAELTVSGIVLPDTVSKEKPQKGKVIAVGPGKMDKSGKRVPMEVKVGDAVIFTKYGPHEVKIDGKEYLIANESDVMAVIEE